MNLLGLHNLPDSYIVVFFLLMAILGIPGNLFIDYLHSLPLLKRAMEIEKFELIEKKYNLFDSGPFAGKRSFAQVIFRIKVKDKDGVVGDGWACVGSWFFGTYGCSFSHQVRFFLPTFYKDVKFKTIDLEG